MPFRLAVVQFCLSCLGTTCLSGSLWSNFVFLALGPHAFPDHCGLISFFLPWDHTLFRITVVQFRFSCPGTTRFSGSLWSNFAFLSLGPHSFPDYCGRVFIFLTLGPHAFPVGCGLVLFFLLWDHIWRWKQFFHSPFLCPMLRSGAEKALIQADWRARILCGKPCIMGWTLFEQQHNTLRRL